MSIGASPLSGIRIVDLGTGLCAALAVKLLVEAGASVTRFEAPAGDPFHALYPAYRFWHHGKTLCEFSPAALDAALAGADVCVIGGEAHPDLDWRHDAQALRTRHPRLVVMDIGAAPAGWNGGDFPAVEILAQARTGFVFEHHAARPIMSAFPVAGYGAALAGALGVLAALWARDAGGEGDVVSTSLVQGLMRWCTGIWAEVEHPTPAYKANFPKDMQAFRFQCADGAWVHLTPGVAGTFAKLNRILGIEDPAADPNARALPGLTTSADPTRVFGDADRIVAEIRNWPRAAFLDAFYAAGLGGEPVLAPGECWDDEQTRLNGVIARHDDGWQGVGSPLRLCALDTKAPDRPPVARQAGRGPLDGVRIVDLGNYIAGPHASVLLGDLGADVIKIERLEGDPTRAQFHFFASSNRGKRSVAIDARQPEGLAVIARVCTGADIVHHNFRPGVAERLGVDAVTLARLRPDIIVLDSSAYGPTGPKAARPGFDSIGQAVSGLEIPAGGAGNPPASYRYSPVDYGTGMLAAIGMLGALHARRRSGRAIAVNACLLNTGVFLLSELVRDPQGVFHGAPRNNAAQTGPHPAECLYRAADGWLAIAARGERMAAALLRALALDGSIGAPCAAWGEAEHERIAAAIRGQTVAEVLRALHAAGVWAEPCAASVASVLADPLVERIGLVLPSQDAALGRMRQIGTAACFAAGAPPPARAAAIPAIGEHTRGILAQCGYSAEEIDGLLARGIVR